MMEEATRFSGDSALQLKKEAFLVQYADLGTITHAADAIGVTRQSIYDWKQEDTAFAEAVGDAKERFADKLVKEAYRRALTPNVSKMGDALLMFCIKANRPEFRDQVTITPSESVITFKVVRVEVMEGAKPAFNLLKTPVEGMIEGEKAEQVVEAS